MKATLSILLLIVSLGANGLDTLKISQAIKQRNITIQAKANGGLGENALHLEIKNSLSRPQLIQMEPGLYFASDDPGIQDLVLFEDEIIALAPRETKSLDFYGACTQLSNLSPGKDEAYQISSTTNPFLTEIAEVVASNDFYNTTAQAAVWAITDNKSTADLHNGDNVDVTWELAKMIAEHKRLQLPEREKFFENPLPFRRILYSARKDLVYHSPEPFQGTLALYTSEGELIREYFKDKSYENGLHFYSVGINNIVEENVQYVARLTDKNGDTIVEHLLDPNEPYVAVKEQVLSVNFEYAVRKRDNYDMVVYDDQENLIEYIYKNRPLTPAYRPARFRFIHAQPESAFFTVKIIDSEGNIVKAQKVINP